MIQENNRFFRFLWRFNALIIAACALLVMLIALLFLYNDVMRWFERNYHVTDIVRTDPEQVATETFTLSDFSIAKGANAVMVRVDKAQSFSRRGTTGRDFSSSYPDKHSYNNLVNIIFIDMKSNEQKRLFKTNDYLILNISTMYTTTQETDATRRASALLYQVVERDTNGDGRLSASDKLTLMASTPEGANLITVTDGMDDVHKLHDLGDNRFKLFFSKDGTYQVTDIALWPLTIGLVQTIMVAPPK